MGFLASAFKKGPAGVLGLPDPLREAVFGGDDDEKPAAPRPAAKKRSLATKSQNFLGATLLRGGPQR